MELNKVNSIKGTAFAKYLESVGPTFAKAYLLQCLKTGGEDNIAWELWSECGLVNIDPACIDQALDVIYNYAIEGESNNVK